MLDALKRLIKSWEEDGNGVGPDACEREFLRKLSGNVARGPAHPARILIAAAEACEARADMEEDKRKYFSDDRTDLDIGRGVDIVRRETAAWAAYHAAVEASDGK